MPWTRHLLRRAAATTGDDGAVYAGSPDYMWTNRTAASLAPITAVTTLGATYASGLRARKTCELRTP
ncbi:hypothetical protein ABZ892_12525 [Streptomyces sp. NPDC046924]|uniref:hypothetical protein n=1 Tax=Streptomyces sp. NPDC046924 TaxID=3155136 RepID=UPI0033E2FEFD